MTPDRKAHLQAVCKPILVALEARCSGLLWASVSTRDGIEVASIGDQSNDKLSVMTSTMHALADGIVAEAALEACHNVMMDAEGGRIVILSVRDGGGNLVLAGMCQPETNMGMLLAFCSSACEEIGRATAAPVMVALLP